MPVKARYWKNPEKHRVETRNRRRLLYALGIRYDDQLSPLAYLKKLADKRAYMKLHRAENTLAVARYRRKIIRTVGSSGAFGRWKYRLIRQAQNAKIKKSLAQSVTPLSQKLVAHKG